MKKLVIAIACVTFCFSMQAQTQLDKSKDGNGEAKVVKTSEVTPAQAPQTYELKDAKTEAVRPHTNCPNAATCPKAQAAANQGEAAKPACCAKHQAATQAPPPEADDKAKTEQKTGCNHQNADQKANCNHGSGDKPACPKKQEEGKK